MLVLSFLYCSDTCKRYATIMNLHDCTFTPPVMVQLMKGETESYLGLKNDDHNDNTNMCNFCSTNKIDLPEVMYSISVPNVKELPTVIENVKHGIGPITNKDAKKSNNKRIIKERYKYIVTLYAHE